MIEIVVAVITSVLGLVGIILTNMSSNKKVEASLQTSQAVTDYKIDELTREVRQHNNFAVKIPVIEQKIETLEKAVENLRDDGK